MPFFLHEVLRTLVSLPFLFWALSVFGVLMFLMGWRRVGGWLVVFGLLLMYFSSAPGVVYPVAKYWSHMRVPAPPAGAQAIVVLGAGRVPAPQYGENGGLTLLAAQRLRYAAWLERRTRLPLLLSGGFGHPGSQDSESQLMQRALIRGFHIRARWLEKASTTTWQNARDSARLLKPLGIERVLLVTQAWHMPRAMWAFRRAGMRPIPAPAGYMLPVLGLAAWQQWMPNARAARDASLLWHEFLGMLWYRIRWD